MLLDAPARTGGRSCSALGAALFGRLDWWPRPAPDAFSALVGALAGGGQGIVPGRPPRRPSQFADAGITILQNARAASPEIWCRCDGGPHGFLPSRPTPTRTRCPWRCATAESTSWPIPAPTAITASPSGGRTSGPRSRTTRSRSPGSSQSAEGGPFLWLRHAQAREFEVQDAGDAEAGPPSTTATRHCTRRAGTAARSGSTRRSAPWTSSI